MASAQSMNHVVSILRERGNQNVRGVFDKIKGLVVGQFSDMPSDELFPYSPYEIIQRAVAEYDFPVLLSLSCTMCAIESF